MPSSAGSSGCPSLVDRQADWSRDHRGRSAIFRVIQEWEMIRNIKKAWFVFTIYDQQVTNVTRVVDSLNYR
jgi:hypothetical protein